MLDASKMLGTSFLGPFFTFSFHAFNMSFSRALPRNRFATQLDFSIIIIIIIAVTLRGGCVILPGCGMRAKHGLPLWQRQHTFRGRRQINHPVRRGISSHSFDSSKYPRRQTLARSMDGVAQCQPGLGLVIRFNRSLAFQGPRGEWLRLATRTVEREKRSENSST